MTQSLDKKTIYRQTAGNVTTIADSNHIQEFNLSLKYPLDRKTTRQYGVHMSNTT